MTLEPVGAGGRNDADKGGLFGIAGVAVAGAETGGGGACSDIVASLGSSGSGSLM